MRSLRTLWLSEVISEIEEGWAGIWSQKGHGEIFEDIGWMSEVISEIEEGWVGIWSQKGHGEIFEDIGWVSEVISEIEEGLPGNSAKDQISLAAAFAMSSVKGSQQ